MDLKVSSPTLEGPPPGSKGVPVDIEVIKAHLASLSNQDGHCRYDNCYAIHNDPIGNPNPHGLLYSFANDFIVGKNDTGAVKSTFANDSIVGKSEIDTVKSMPPPPLPLTIHRPITRSMTTRPPSRSSMSSRISIRGGKIIMTPASGFSKPTIDSGNRYTPYSVPKNNAIRSAPKEKPTRPISTLPIPPPPITIATRPKSVLEKNIPKNIRDDFNIFSNPTPSDPISSRTFSPPDEKTLKEGIDICNKIETEFLQEELINSKFKEVSNRLSIPPPADSPLSPLSDDSTKTTVPAPKINSPTLSYADDPRDSPMIIAPIPSVPIEIPNTHVPPHFQGKFHTIVDIKSMKPKTIVDSNPEAFHEAWEKAADMITDVEGPVQDITEALDQDVSEDYSDRSLKSLLNRIVRRQDFTIAQNMIQFDEVNKRIDSIGATKEISRLSNIIESLVAQLGPLQKEVAALKSKTNVQASSVPSFQNHNPSATDKDQTNPPIPNTRARGRSRSRGKPSNPPPPPKILFDVSHNYALCLSPSHEWFSKQLESLSDERVHWWSTVLCIGQWGPPTVTGNPSGVNPNNSTNDKRNFILRCIQFHFSQSDRRSDHKLPIPPTKPVSRIGKESIQDYDWIVFDGKGEPQTRIPGSQVEVRFPVWRTITRNMNPKSFAKTVQNFEHIPNKPSYSQTAVEAANFVQPNWPSPSDASKKTRVDEVEDFPALNPYGNPPDDGWNTVSNKKTTKPVSFANVAGQSRPSAPFRRRVPTDPNMQKWIMSFPTTKPSILIPPHIITNKINHQCGKIYHINAVLAEWSPRGNLSITFSSISSEKNIKNASATIISIISPDDTSSPRFAKIVPWSKILYRDVPCRKFSASQFDGDDMMSQDLWDKDELLEAVRNSHPLLKEVTFTQDPDWTWPVNRIPASATTFNVCFSIEDAEGQISKTLSTADAVMFATLVYPTGWKEKLNLTQCQRCWTLGTSHTECDLVCRICGSNRHTEKTHNINCNGCKDTGVPLNTLSSPDWTCSHFKCRNCGDGHPSDDKACPNRDAAVQQGKVNNLRAGQYNSWRQASINRYRQNPNRN